MTYQTSEWNEVDNTVFEQLHKHIAEMEHAEAEVVAAQEALKAAQEKHRELSEQRIPELMETLGLEEFTTKSGRRVKIKTKIRASIAGARKHEAIQWLEENGHGSLIKRTVMVAFDRTQQSDAKNLLTSLRGKFAGVKEEIKVEPMTLTKFVNDILKEGKEIPCELFGVYHQRFTEVSLIGE